MSTPVNDNHGRATAGHARRSRKDEADQEDLAGLIEQAQALKVSLRDAVSKTSELIAALRKHRKQSKIVASILASLRQFRAIDA